jgi:hypothetical protein
LGKGSKQVNINEVFPSKYLKASDLQGKSVKVVVDRIEIEKMGEDTKPVLYFKGKGKGMVLNKSNAQVIAAHYSPETAGWLGKEIKLYPGKVNFNGQMVDSLKIEIIPPSDGPDDALPDFS